MGAENYLLLELFVILLGSVYLTLLIFRFVKSVKNRAVLLVAMIPFILLLLNFSVLDIELTSFSFKINEPIRSRGGDDIEVAPLIMMFISMVLGMLFNYLFNRYMKSKQDRLPFDLGVFLAPVLISPIIYVPLYSLFQSGEFTTTDSRIMLYLVSFENGFFWKEFFDNKLRNLTKPSK